MDALRKEDFIYTVEDIYALPEGKRAELLDGELYLMAPPSTAHQRLIAEFVYQIETYIRRKQGTCQVFPAPFAVFLNKNDKTYVEPDITVVCDKDKITDQGCNGAPDWIVEIVSPSSRKMDYYKKLFKYRTAGVKEYWVVDPDKKLVTVYNFAQDNMEEYSWGDSIPVGICEDFAITMP